MEQWVEVLLLKLGKLANQRAAFDKREGKPVSDWLTPLSVGTCLDRASNMEGASTPLSPNSR